MTKIQFETRTCSVCGKSDVMELDYGQYLRWQRGMLVQKAFPDMSADRREQLITGTHPECWQKLFSEVEED